MMNGSSNSSKFPFTATQFQELQHQALIYKYMASNIPVPSDLLFSIRRSCSLDHSKMFPSHTIGWSCFQLGGGKKIDPEPGRCRRTDGKKWRCSKEAYPDSKYCERHMHRGKNRSRKPVEVGNQTTSSAVQQQQQQLHYNSAGSFSLTNTDYRSSYGLKEANEQAFFGEPTRDDAWQFTPLTMNSSSSRGVSGLQNDYSYLQLRSFNDQQNYSYVNGNMRSEQRDENQQQTVHRFFDDLPAKNRDSWLDLDDKSQSGSSSVSTTRLSISIPSPSHDFPSFTN